MLGQQIALAEDELTGQGLYEGNSAVDERRLKLEQQIKVWQALQEKLVEKA